MGALDSVDISDIEGDVFVGDGDTTNDRTETPASFYDSETEIPAEDTLETDSKKKKKKFPFHISLGKKEKQKNGGDPGTTPSNPTTPKLTPKLKKKTKEKDNMNISTNSLNVETNP